MISKAVWAFSMFQGRNDLVKLRIGTREGSTDLHSMEDSLTSRPNFQDLSATSWSSWTFRIRLRPKRLGDGGDRANGQREAKYLTGTLRI
jgi:hypothetical protein